MTICNNVQNNLNILFFGGSVRPNQFKVRAPQDVDVLVFVHGPWDTNEVSQDGNKEFGNPGRRGRRRPAEACPRFQIIFGLFLCWTDGQPGPWITTRMSIIMTDNL